MQRNPFRIKLPTVLRLDDWTPSTWPKSSPRCDHSLKEPNLFVDVDPTLCIGCCSCEIIAPDVFQINKESMSNPKSTVINRKGAGVNKIMNAAKTCPTKAIIVDDLDTKERLFPY